MEENLIERIGVLGGSFDPVHIGHLTIAQDAVEQLELDRLVFIPADVPPHKQNRMLAEGRHRLAMLKLAVEDNPVFEASDMELQRGGVSYTIDTVRALQDAHPLAEIFFIVGLDSLTELHCWHKIEKLLDSCSVVPFGRGGESPEAIAERMQLPGDWARRLMERMIRIHEVEVSSSEIRMRVAEGLSIRYLVPPEVEMYIAEHRLYS